MLSLILKYITWVVAQSQHSLDIAEEALFRGSCSVRLVHFGHLKAVAIKGPLLLSFRAAQWKFHKHYKTQPLGCKNGWGAVRQRKWCRQLWTVAMQRGKNEVVLVSAKCQSLTAECPPKIAVLRPQGLQDCCDQWILKGLLALKINVRLCALRARNYLRSFPLGCLWSGDTLVHSPLMKKSAFVCCESWRWRQTGQGLLVMSCQEAAQSSHLARNEVGEDAIFVLRDKLATQNGCWWWSIVLATASSWRKLEAALWPRGTWHSGAWHQKSQILDRPLP